MELELDYNAIVRDTKNIIALTKVTHLSQIPEHCKVLYRNEIVERDQHIENILISKTEPLQIYMESKLTLLVKPFDCFNDEILNISVDCVDNIWELKKQIALYLNFPAGLLRLNYAGRKLENNVRLFEYGIQNLCLIELELPNLDVKIGEEEKVLDLTVTHGLRSQISSCMTNIWSEILQLWNYMFNSQEREYEDVSAEFDTLPLIESTWQQGHPGLNICGKCSNDDCASNTKQHIVLPMRFGKVKFEHTQNFECPACTQNTFSIQSIQYFVTSFCRTLVYIRSSKSQKVTTKLLESPEPFPSYNIWKSPSDMNAFANAEMITVSKNSSPFYCNKCSIMIRSKYAEKQLECGHTYHSNCFDDTACIICSAQFKSLCELFGSLSDLGIEVEDTFVSNALPDNAVCDKWNFEFEACLRMLKIAGKDAHFSLEMSESSLGNLYAENKIQMLLSDEDNHVLI